MLDFITKSSSDQVPYFHTLLRHTGDLNFCLKHPAQILFFIIVSIISIFIITIIIMITVFLLLQLLYHPMKGSGRGLSLLWVPSILLLLLLLLFSYFTTNIISGIVVSQNIKLHPIALGVQYFVQNLCCAQQANLLK